MFTWSSKPGPYVAIRELCNSPHCTTVIPLIAELCHVMLLKVCKGPSVIAFVLVSERRPAAGRSAAYKRLHPWARTTTLVTGSCTWMLVPLCSRFPRRTFWSEETAQSTERKTPRLFVFVPAELEYNRPVNTLVMDWFFCLCFVVGADLAVVLFKCCWLTCPRACFLKCIGCDQYKCSAGIYAS